MSEGLYVHYGCGLCAPEGWLNFDASPTLHLQRLPLIGGLARRWVKPKFPLSVQFGDIVKGLPVQPESCDGVYCSHVLEHLALADFRAAIRNSFVYVRKGGSFRLVVPDLRLMANEYLASHDPSAAEVFVRNTRLGLQARPRGIGGRMRQLLGNDQHLWMWDCMGLEKELLNVGFCQIRLAKYGDSGDAMFEAVEDPARWQRAVGIQCSK